MKHKNISPKKLARLKQLCAKRDKLNGEAREINREIATIRAEVEAVLRLSDVPPGVVARARVIPCAGQPKKFAKPAKAKKPATPAEQREDWPEADDFEHGEDWQTGAQQQRDRFGMLHARPGYGKTKPAKKPAKKATAKKKPTKKKAPKKARVLV